MSDDPLTVCCQHLAKSQHIIEEKNAEIARLKRAILRLADQDATLSVVGGNVIVEMDATLTDEEREAVEAAIVDDELMDAHTRAATLRGLLERTK